MTLLVLMQEGNLDFSLHFHYYCPCSGIYHVLEWFFGRLFVLLSHMAPIYNPSYHQTDLLNLNITHLQGKIIYCIFILNKGHNSRNEPELLWLLPALQSHISSWLENIFLSRQNHLHCLWWGSLFIALCSCSLCLQYSPAFLSWM